MKKRLLRKTAELMEEAGQNKTVEQKRKRQFKHKEEV